MVVHYCNREEPRVNRTPVCTEAFEMESEGVGRGNVGLRVREVKNSKLGWELDHVKPKGAC